MSTRVIPGRVKTVTNTIQLALDTKAVNGERRLRGYASTRHRDRYDERILPEAYAKTVKAFKKNPVMLYMHSVYAPIGTWDTFKIDDEGLYVEGVIGRGFEPADTAWLMAEQGILRAMSVGFRIVKADDDEDEAEGKIFTIREVELYEISLVSIPANREALFTLGDDGELRDIRILAESLEAVDDQDLVTELENRGMTEALERGVVPYRRYPAAPPSEDAFDPTVTRLSLSRWATDKGQINAAQLRSGFAYVIEAAADRPEVAVLPHHLVRDGALVTDQRAVRAAAAVLAGAQGGLPLPDNAIRGTFNHLARHLQEDFQTDIPSLETLAPQDSASVIAALGTTAEDCDKVIADWKAAVPTYVEPPFRVLSAGADTCGRCLTAKPHLLRVGSDQPPLCHACVLTALAGVPAEVTEVTGPEIHVSLHTEKLEALLTELTEQRTAAGQVAEATAATAAVAADVGRLETKVNKLELLLKDFVKMEIDRLARAVRSGGMNGHAVS